MKPEIYRRQLLPVHSWFMETSTCFPTSRKSFNFEWVCMCVCAGISVLENNTYISLEKKEEQFVTVYYKLHWSLAQVPAVRRRAHTLSKLSSYASRRSCRTQPGQTRLSLVANAMLQGLTMANDWGVTYAQRQQQRNNHETRAATLSSSVRDAILCS